MKLLPQLSWALLFACLTVMPAAAQSTSASYTLDRSTLNAGGVPMTSASYQLISSLGQESTVEASSSPGGTEQSGFWSLLGVGRVPLFLTVDHTAGLAEHVDLTWSGNKAPYDIYRATDCSNVTASLFDSTSANTYGAVPPLPGIVCFMILESP